MHTVSDPVLAGKTVLVRVDFNVPLTPKGEVADDTRIRLSIPTITALLHQDCVVVLLTHLGRPVKKDPAWSTKRIQSCLSKLLKRPVTYVPGCIGLVVKNAIQHAQPRDVILLENIRFFSKEEKNDPVFAKQLASLADAYVNEAFSNSHRAHASMVGIPKYLPSYAGLLLQKEITALSTFFGSVKKPFVVILGGSKVADKIPLIKRLATRADHILIGGAMFFTFLAAQGHMVGSSIVDRDHLAFARRMLATGKIILPLDVVVTNGNRTKTVLATAIPQGWSGRDIGHRTVRAWTRHLTSARTTFWNGPLGQYENPNFAKGTNAIARIMAGAKGFRCIGGGDSADVINHLRLAKKFNHVSTGGGAALEYLAYEKLPGIIAITHGKHS